MSCWREQVVLRIPARAIGIETMDEWYRFEQEHEDVLDWEAGCFAPSLCTYDHGPFLDYILSERIPTDEIGSEWDARELTEKEKENYLPVFRTLFPEFTMERMNDVHYCEYRWYDGTDAPYCY